MGGGDEGMHAGATALFRLIAAIVAAGLSIMLVQYGFGRAAAALPLADHIALAETLLTVLLFALLAIMAVIGLRVARERVSMGRPLDFGIGAILGIAGVGTALTFAALAGVIGRGEEAAGMSGLILLGTVTTAWQTGVEELYFRGWLQAGLQAGWGRWPGLVASALAFAILHLLAGATAGVGLATITLAGLWFGLLAERSGGLLMPIGAHFGWNWAEELLFGASPNTGIGSYGAIINLDLVGAAGWAGGDEGLNASLAALFVLGALIALTFAWPAGARAPVAVRA